MKQQFTLEDAKKKANNQNLVIRPIGSDGKLLQYAFTVVDGVMYDDKGKKETEKTWKDCLFRVQNKREQS